MKKRLKLFNFNREEHSTKIRISIWRSMVFIYSVKNLVEEFYSTVLYQQFEVGTTTEQNAKNCGSYLFKTLVNNVCLLWPSRGRVSKFRKCLNWMECTYKSPSLINIYVFVLLNQSRKLITFAYFCVCSTLTFIGHYIN